MTTSIACALLWALIIPLALILWLSESREQRIRRWHREGMSQQRIATKLGTTRWQVRRALA